MNTLLDEFLKKFAPHDEQWAKAADGHADKMDRAGDIVEFRLNEHWYEEEREKLLKSLLSLGESGSLAWTADGLGLLSVPNFLQQRDPSLYGLYTKVRDNITAYGGAKEFACSVESHLFVYPDRGPLEALVKGCQRLSRARNFDPISASYVFEYLVSSLRTDDFWVPQGTSSLDGFLKKLSPEGDPGSSGPGTAADETTVRKCLNEHDWEWAKLRDDLKVSNEDQLRQILKFREELTRGLMDKARDQHVKKAQQRYGNRFRWVTYVAAGSARLTSDHDVSTFGSATEWVVGSFNALFRKWTLGEVDPKGEERRNYNGPSAPAELESGYVFDVNVYANDYLRNQGRRFLVPDDPDPDFWPKDKDKRKTAECCQDLYGLLKLRRYMEDGEWKKFRTTLQQALAPREQEATEKLLNWVTDLWKGLKEEVDKQVGDVKGRFENMPSDNVKIRAENELYQKQLEEVEKIRYNNGAPLNDEARVRFAEAQGKAGFYAQEKYHTSGAVRDVVANVQQRKGVSLSQVELLCSLNEQVGDLFKEISHLEGEPVKSPGNDLDFAVKTSKYMVRLGNAALGLNYRMVDRLLDREFQQSNAGRRMFEKKTLQAFKEEERFVDKILAELSRPVNEQVDALLDLQSLCNAWRDSTARLLEIKDSPADFKGADGSWTKEATDRLEAVPWQQSGVPDLRTFLIKLAAASNAQLRGGQSVDAFSRFLKECWVSAVGAAKTSRIQPTKRGLKDETPYTRGQ